MVFEGLFAKFSQNVKLRKQLKGTGDVIWAECAVKDRIWGIGLSMNDPDRFDRVKWNGQNLLGYALVIETVSNANKEIARYIGGEYSELL